MRLGMIGLGRMGLNMARRLSQRLFQFTRPRGARHDDIDPYPDNSLVSIHAPARGATVGLGRAAIILPVSIHAPARGATAPVLALSQLNRFQSTRPRGARPSRRRYVPGHPGFNPRAREGRDPIPGKLNRPGSGFNPRAREGRDCQSARPYGLSEVSIHAPARGATFPFVTS